MIFKALLLVTDKTEEIVKICDLNSVTSGVLKNHLADVHHIQNEVLVQFVILTQ